MTTHPPITAEQAREARRLLVKLSKYANNSIKVHSSDDYKDEALILLRHYFEQAATALGYDLVRKDTA